MRFAVRGLWQSGASPRSNRPPGGQIGDVACRVDVGVGLVPAGNAPEESLALATLRGGVAAGVAGLRRVTRVDLDHPSGCLVSQPGHQLSPPAGEDASVQPALVGDPAAGFSDGALRRTGHRPDLQIFDTDHIEPACQIGAGLLHPVLTPIGFAGLQPGDGRREFRPAVRPASRFRASALQPQKPFRLCLTQAGRGQQISGGQGRADRHTPVHTDDFTGPRCGDRVGDRGERDMPTTRPITGDAKRLNGPGHGTRPAEPHPPHLRNPHLTDMPGQTPHVTGFDRDDPEPVMPSCLTPCRPTMRAAKEIGHGLGEIFERLLLHDDRPRTQPRESRSRFGQLTTLPSEPRRDFPSGFPVRVLLDSQIPHEPCVPAMFGQSPLLGRRGPKTEAGHADQPNDPHRQNPETTMTDHAAFPPRPQGRDLHAVGAW